MFCKNCGRELIDGIQFCGNCGTKISSQQTGNNSIGSNNDQKSFSVKSSEKMDWSGLFWGLGLVAVVLVIIIVVIPVVKSGVENMSNRIIAESNSQQQRDTNNQQSGTTSSNNNQTGTNSGNTQQSQNTTTTNSASNTQQTSSNTQQTTTNPSNSNTSTPAPNSGNDFEITQNANGGITITDYRGSRGQVVIPETIEGIRVTEIGEAAFSEKGLSGAIIPNTVALIGSGAFKNNPSLQSVVIPNSVVEIGWNAFENCGLRSLTLGNRVKYIGREAFHGNQLQSVVFPNSVECLDYYSFGGNPITSVVIPQSLASFNFSIYAVEKRGFERAFITTQPGSSFNIENTSITTITLPTNVNSNNLGEYNIPNNFGAFYEGQNKRAGTYAWTGRIWTVK
jgi:hypothetical protein